MKSRLTENTNRVGRRAAVIFFLPWLLLGSLNCTSKIEVASLQQGPNVSAATATITVSPSGLPSPKIESVEKVELPTPHFALDRPSSQFTVRLNFARVCGNCRNDFTQAELISLAGASDSIHSHFNYLANMKDNTEFQAFRSQFPKFPFLAKGLGIPLAYSKESVRPFSHKGEVGVDGLHTSATSVDPARWAVDIDQSRGRSTYWTADPMFSSVADVSLEHPIHHYNFSVKQTVGPVYQIDGGCQKRNSNETQKVSEVSALVPNLVSRMLAAKSSWTAATPYSIFALEPGRFFVTKEMSFYGFGERAIIDGGRFFKDLAWSTLAQVRLQNVACFAIDPSKAEAATVLADAMNDTIDAAGATSFIADNMTDSFIKSSRVTLDSTTKVPTITNGGTVTPLYTHGVPWKQKDVAGREVSGTLIEAGSGELSGHYRPKFETLIAPDLSFAKAFLKMVKETSANLSAHGKSLMPNMNALMATLSLMATTQSFDENLQMSKEQLGNGFWHEKWGRDNIRTQGGRMRVYMEMAAAREASVNNRTAVLSSIYLNYNGGEIGGFPGTVALERGLAKYLIVLDKPSLQLHPVRYRGEYTKRKNSPEDGWSLDSALEYFARRDLAKSYVATLLDLKAGAPTSEHATVHGHFSVMARQYENLLALENVTNTDQTVKLPARTCSSNATNCSQSYYYVRVSPWRVHSGGPDADWPNKDWSYAPLPLHCRQGQWVNFANYDSCVRAIMDGHATVPPTAIADPALEVCNQVCETIPASVVLSCKRNPASAGCAPSPGREFAAVRDEYRAGEVVQLKAGESLVLFNAEGLPFEQLGWPLKQHAYLSAPGVASPIELDFENDPEFLTDPGDLSGVGIEILDVY